MEIVVHKIYAARFDYEYMGKSVQELSKLYGFPEHLIEQEIVNEAWERKLEPQSLPDTKDITAFAKALEDQTRTKLSIIALFRQIEHQPLLAQIEKEVLEKILALVSSISDMDDRAANKIKALVDATNAISERNPVSLADELGRNKNSSGLVVQILNQIQ